MKKIVETKLAETFESTIKDLQKEGHLTNIKEFTLDLNENKLNIKLIENEKPSLEEEIIRTINDTDYFTAKIDGRYIRVLKNGREIADFNLESGITRSYHAGLMPSSRGDGRNTFRVCDVALSMYDDGGKSFLTVLGDEERYLSKLNEVNLIRYYTLKALHQKDNIYGYKTPREVSHWYCAQWGTWKFDIETVEDVYACIAALEDAVEQAKS